jgi:hypothetical protein
LEEKVHAECNMKTARQDRKSFNKREGKAKWRKQNGEDKNQNAEWRREKEEWGTNVSSWKKLTGLI